MMDEGALGDPAPPVSEVEAARLAAELYDLGEPAEVSAAALPGEYDANFEISSRSLGRRVLKVMHPARERSLVDLQISALEHLARKAPALVVPRVQKTREGDSMSAVTVQADRSGVSRIIWMLSFLEGRPLAEARPRRDELLVGLGRTLGALDSGLSDFTHPAGRREFKWDLSRATWIENEVGAIEDPARRAWVEAALARFRTEVSPALGDLRRSFIHSDANDYNVLVPQAGDGSQEGLGLIDFGDMHVGLTVAEVAVGATYALLGHKDPLPAAARVARGYHAVYPLREREVDCLLPLILARLAVSVVNSAIRKKAKPGDPYVTISEAPAWEALERLSRIPPQVGRALLRHACGYAATPRAGEVATWLRANAGRMAPVLGANFRDSPPLTFDLGVGSSFLGADPANAETSLLTERVFSSLRKAGARVGVGRYDEARLLYVSPLFGQGESPTDERRTVHLGIDLFVEPDAAIHAPIEGAVHILANNEAHQDYGPMVVLRHEPPNAPAFFTLYGHLRVDTLTALKEGQRVLAGEEIARVGSPPSNGDWPPHLHFQIIVDLLGLGREFPGVCRDSEREMWKTLSPDPNLILGIPVEYLGERPPDRSSTLEKRKQLVGGSLRLSYENPLKIVRGFGVWLFDETGRAFLDMYNNVPLVGHSHPRVVAAIQDQAALLNTNTRYLHDGIVEYAERLTGLLPETLRTCFFVNSGSEANDLALRMARTHTGRNDIIVLENAYHGHTSALIDVSPYKFGGKGGSGRKPFVHMAPMPDDYRGRYRRSDPEAGTRYGREVGRLASELKEAGTPPAAFIAESLPSVGGQIVPPPGYLAEAYRQVRAAGGLCIADEVQVGFGRLGRHCWGFESQEVVPDMVVLGKPMGNGFPLAAVVTTVEVSRSFDNGMEFFSTFGGNPVACAAGLAVLDVVRDEGLQGKALETGRHLDQGLRALMSRHPLIGDVRGAGLFLGVECVRDRETLEPAPQQASYIVNRLRDLGVLTGTDGPHENVLKLRPPLVLEAREADLFLSLLDQVLEEDGAGL